MEEERRGEDQKSKEKGKRWNVKGNRRRMKKRRDILLLDPVSNPMKEELVGSPWWDKEMWIPWFSNRLFYLPYCEVLRIVADFFKNSIGSLGGI